MKKGKTLLSLFIAALMLPRSSFSCELRVAWDSWAPYQMRDGKNVSGFDIEILNGIAGKAGCKINYVEQSWSRSLNGLKTGKIDMVGGASISDERKRQYKFSDPYRIERMTLFIRKEDSSRFQLQNVSDIIAYSMKVSVIEDYSYGDEFDAIANGPDSLKYIVYAKDPETEIKNVVNGAADAFIDDELVGIYHAKKNNAFDKLELSRINISTDNVYFMFSKKVPDEIVDKINFGIKEFEASQDYKNLINKYTR